MFKTYAKSLCTCQELHIFLVIEEAEFPPIANVILQNLDANSNVLKELDSILQILLSKGWSVL